MVIIVLIVIAAVIFGISRIEKSDKIQKISVWEDQVTYMYNYVFDILICLYEIIHSQNSEKHFLEFKKLILNNEKIEFVINEQLKQIKRAHTKEEDQGYQEITNLLKDIKQLKAAASQSNSSTELLSRLNGLQSMIAAAFERDMTKEEIERNRIGILNEMKQGASYIRESI